VNYNTVYVGMFTKVVLRFAVSQLMQIWFLMPREWIQITGGLWNTLSFCVPSTEMILTLYAVMRLDASVLLYIIS